MTAMRQQGRNGQQIDTQIDRRHAAWIAGRIETLLSHYYQPDQPREVLEAALDDWVELLAPLSKQSIDAACSSWLRDEPRKRPTPGDIRARAKGEIGASQNQKGDRSKLSFDQRALLDDQIIPTARRWLKIPGLAEHGRKTLEYWGESDA